MLFWLFVIVTVVGMFLLVLSDRTTDYDKSELEYGIGSLLTIVGWVMILLSTLIMTINYIGINAKVERYNARYESLVYQYENDIYENDNDLGKKELMDDIQEWNEDLSYRKKIQDDFWLGIYYPNIYDQFEKIELKQKGEVKWKLVQKKRYAQNACIFGFVSIRRSCQRLQVKQMLYLTTVVDLAMY